MYTGFSNYILADGVISDVIFVIKKYHLLLHSKGTLTIILKKDEHPNLSARFILSEIKFQTYNVL